MGKLGKAGKAFKDFSGHTPTKVHRSRLDDRDVAGWQMGPVVGIAYEAKRDGQTDRYFHEFKKSARPNLIARDDGKQLYIEGGRYKVTDHGIEDMPQLFVVNPSPRPSRRGTEKKRKAKPMAARRRRRTTTRRRTRQVAVFNTNPIRRRRRKTTTARRHHRRRRSLSVFRSNPAPRRHRRRRTAAVRRYRRNPSARRMGGAAVSLGKMFIPAAGIGLGAVGAEIIMGYLPIPANFKTGVMRHVTKGVVGVAAGMLIGKVLRQKRLGNYIALGAVVIAVHDGVKELIASKMPAVHLGQYRGPIRGSLGGMGYTNPGMIGQYRGPVAGSFHGAPQTHNSGGETSFAV